MSGFSADQKRRARATKAKLVRLVIDGLHLGPKEIYVDVSGPCPQHIVAKFEDLLDEWAEANEAQGRTIH